MSRGLGTVQRAVLAALEASSFPGWWRSLEDLGLSPVPDPDHWFPTYLTESEQSALMRAIRSLRRRGLVDIGYNVLESPRNGSTLLIRLPPSEEDWLNADALFDENQARLAAPEPRTRAELQQARLQWQEWRDWQEWYNALGRPPWYIDAAPLPSDSSNTCENCGTQLVQSGRGRPRRACSIECRRAISKHRRSERRREELEIRAARQASPDR